MTMDRNNESSTSSLVLKFGSRGENPGQFEFPNDIAIDKQNILYVADQAHIQVFDKHGKYLSKFKLYCPEYKQEIWNGSASITYNEISDELICPITYKACGLSSKTIQILTMDGAIKHQFTHKHTQAGLRTAVNSSEVIFVSDWNLHCINIHDRNGMLLKSIGEQGDKPGEFNHPLSLCIGKNQDILVADFQNNRIQVFDKDCSFKHQFQVRHPTGLAVDQDGYVIVAERDSGHLKMFSYIGNYLSTLTNTENKLSWPKGLAVTCDGHVLAADNGNHCIKMFKYK